jgi:hypothetical protein
MSERTQEYAETYAEVKRWLAKLQEKDKNVFSLKRFCEWCGKTPTELLALKRDPASKDAEKLLDTFVADENTGFSNSVKVFIVTAVKSFFKHNYCDLARASGAISLEKIKPYNKPSKENLRKLWSWALNPRDKALLTFTCSTAIAKETLTKLKWQHLEDNWENVDLPCVNVPSELLKGHGLGKYKGVKQITFLTPEAKRDLKNYKEWLEQKMGRKLSGEDHIFLNTFEPYVPMAYVRLGVLIWRLGKSAGVSFSWHDARRYVNTALEEIRINPNWARKIRGRKVRGEEAPYSQPAIKDLREKFREAVPLLEFTSETQGVAKELEQRVKALEKFKETLTPEQRELMTKSGLRLRKKERVGEPPKEAENCEDGAHCEAAKHCDFKQITEAELLSHLNAGYVIVHNLQNGEVIVRKI